MKIAVTIVITFLLFTTLRADTLEGRVVKVSDGDTITVLDSTNTQHKVRLNRIDAPEKGQAFGQVSRKYLAGMVTNGTVKVEWKKKDKYGRILGIVYSSDGKETNLEMLKAGLAWHYKHFDNTESYSQAEKDAKEKKVGLWADKNPIEPWNFRKTKKGK